MRRLQSLDRGLLQEPPLRQRRSQIPSSGTCATRGWLQGRAAPVVGYEAQTPSRPPAGAAGGGVSPRPWPSAEPASLGSTTAPPTLVPVGLSRATPTITQKIYSLFGPPPPPLTLLLPPFT
eukprot:scaffold184988_cov36-Tisochrysis_lutea.AAC.1